MVTIDFTSKGRNPNGVQNVVFNLTSASANETVTYIIYALDGTTVLGTENSSADPFTISAVDYSQIGKIDFIADSATYVRIQNISYDEITSAPPAVLDPVLIDYVLTDSDGQSDTAQLSLYTIDQTLNGTTGMDNIAGAGLNDAIIGDAGDDILSGNAGHDSLSGGEGDDTLDGGLGNDYLSGGEGIDTLSGGAGMDHLDGGAGDDILDGGTGDDVVLGGAGDDLVFGGAGDDRLEGGNDNDSLFGGSGDDLLFGDAGADFIYGGQGDDTLAGGSEDDTFVWRNGDDGTAGDPAIDIIVDFVDELGGDVLDLSDLLVGEESNPLTDYLNFQYIDTDSDGDSETVINIDADGGTIFETTQQVILESVDLTEGGTLTTDQDILNSLLVKVTLVTD
jgi:Ca2+-binding RTX toxin-like protein